MSTIQTSSISTDYLKFDAFSIKKLITQRLAENPHFTDYIFEDSNLTTLIDIFSHNYQLLMYYLNHGSAEAMFADAQIYENMNRIVKLLGYNPRGYLTSIVEAVVDGYGGTVGKVLPKYSFVQLTGTDSRGKNKFYSTVDYYYIYPTGTVGQDNNILLYNGVWRLYGKTFISTGIPNEMLLLTDLVSDADQEKYIAFPFVEVYVKRFVAGVKTWINFTPVESGLFLNQAHSTVYKPTDRIFDLRLNENKSITLRFGDGVYGEKLQLGDEIYVTYLDSNGPGGTIGANILNSSSTKGKILRGIAGMSNALFDEIFQDTSIVWLDKTLDIPTIYVTNAAASSTPAVEESVDDIRIAAPEWFKAVGMLRSQDDFQNFIKRKYSTNINDVRVMNNWDYISSFYRWLYNLELQNPGTSLLNNDLSTKYDYPWADAADFNNVYVFLSFKASSVVSKTDIHASLMSLKPLTSEIVFVDPLTKYFIPCAYDDSYNIDAWDTNLDNYIEILVDENALVSPEIVRGRVVDTITQYFQASNQKIGNLINFNTLMSSIYAISGVKRIRTIFKSSDATKPEYIVNDLRFACWTNLIVNGLDKDFVTGTHQLENFQFAQYAEASISARVKVIVDSSLQSTSIEY
jgi:hypothetical protein